ncbi:EAL domain-containing protein [Rhodoferax bucti]|uniref:bifunctional diguanylate cyclase/phosphodiesterase n=1 Tax=Rhodoferax bucti TaxID=2576305 RepID=UPI0011098215|nr:EAL domain-containing protein [Rhodoferax bucti]
MKKPYAPESRFVVLLTAILILAVVSAGLLLARNLHQSAIADGKAQAERFVTGAQAAVNRSFLGVDVLLASLNSQLNLENMQADWLEGPLAGKLIQGATRQNLLVRNVWLLDAEGTVIASSESPENEATLGTLPGFVKLAIEQPVSTLLISQPVLSPSSSEPMLYFARHLKLADGKKLLAVAEVPVNLITTIMVQGADITQLETTLERANGQLLASMPAQDALTGLLLSPALGNSPDTNTAAVQMQSRISQRPAVVASRATLYNELMITASIPMDTVLADWNVQLQVIVFVTALSVLFFAVSGYAGVRYLQSMVQAQHSISVAKATTDQALEAMESGFLLLDAQRRVVTWNRRYLQMYPWQAADIHVGRSFEEMLHITASETLGEVSEDARRRWVANRMAMLSQGLHSHEREFPNGHVIEITERATPDGGVVIVYQDVTRLRRASAEIEQLAFFDPLTNLPNRRLLADRLQQAIAATLRTERHGALLFLDLDHFKTLNDTLGHDVGDLLLQQVAARVKNCVREADTVARLGGDEFVVMLLDLSADPGEAARQTQLVGDNVLRSLNQPYDLKGKQYNSSASIGVALFGDGKQSAAELLKQADIAMYQVKNSGRNALCFFDPGMLAAIESRANLENDLRHGLAERQFELFYQLQVTDTGLPVGAEALIRWHHPSKGLVAPGEFIGLAEDTGLIVPMGLWVLEEACRQLVAWRADPRTAALQLSVNVSARQFRHSEFVDQVRQVLRHSGAPAHLLKLELTESLVLDNVDDTVVKMHALKQLGVRFSMDDFGTGHSSLAYLTRLPLDQLKIDQSFVRNIGVQATDSMIIQTIIGMGNNLGLEVLAEGVETEAQRDFLARHGCHRCQGYLFGKPVPLAAFEAQLLN